MEDVKSKNALTDTHHGLQRIGERDDYWGRKKRKNCEASYCLVHREYDP
jgi:hypothetical protein